ncbi:unnamed protein product [Rotaria sordida]|uniref:Cell wall hydrolase SleB domain-containing protein n=2 Tax=Rotaria sordida TaxID=392033 RepID=A0A820CI78_9BILA|nr:unnamed protein product [Rotaria sordida]CAF4098203.1 unnamed protein product [Rotaria sordida]CAF4223869.1 unnamed protein product [Rotaria sordida]
MVDPQSLDEVDVLTRTVYGEARGESEDGQAAVAWVIMNRVAAGHLYMGRSIREVCLKPYQFSCWDRGDVNRSILINLDTNSDGYRRILRVVKQVLNGTRHDNTHGSTHYHANYIQPDWANGRSPLAIICFTIILLDILNPYHNK